MAMAALTFYFACITLFSSLYGVHALALIRFFHEHDLFRKMMGAVVGAKMRINNPTAKFPKAGRHELVYDLRSRTINGLALNAVFDGVRKFGKCDHTIRSGDGAELFYRESGLVLEFDSGKLLTIVIVIGPGSWRAKQHRMALARPAIIDASGCRHSFTKASTLEDVIRCFGQPIESGQVGGDMMHSFVVEKNFVDSCHDSKTGKLLEFGASLVEAASRTR
jgi:hypothetical protein